MLKLVIFLGAGVAKTTRCTAFLASGLAIGYKRGLPAGAAKTY
jgi:hypothetical protein